MPGHQHRVHSHLPSDLSTHCTKSLHIPERNAVIFTELSLSAKDIVDTVCILLMKVTEPFIIRKEEHM